MRHLFALALIAWLIAAPAAPTQDRADAGGGGILVQLLERSLSAEGRQISIEGMTGSLTGAVSIEKMTVADDDGVWLTLQDMVLDWNSDALLRGRIEVTTLTATNILMARLPHAGPSPWSPAASEFRLPDLPVAVQIDELRGESVMLDAAVLGQDVAFRVDGAVSLAEGGGKASLSAHRTDRIAGTLQLDMAYDRAARDFSVDLQLSEAAGGLVAGLLGLPGQPASALSVRGSGSAGSFLADIRLSTGGQERLAGQLSMRLDPNAGAGAAAPARLFEARLAGDMAPLFAPDYRDFFGRHVALSAKARRLVDGEIILDRLDVGTRALSITGSARIAPDGCPAAFSLSGRVAGHEGRPVLLPLPGPGTWADNASFDLAFDAAEGNHWTLAAQIAGLRRQGMTIGSLRVDGAGQISPPTTDSGGVSANIEFAADGMAFDGGARDHAFGGKLTGTLGASWQKGAPLRIDQFAISGPAWRAAGAVTIGGLSEALEVAGRIELNAGDMSRFARLSGLDLKGAGRAELTGRLRPLDGAFDLDIAMHTAGLAVGHAELDRLLAGQAKLDMSAERNTAGLAVHSLAIEAEAANLHASGFLSPGGGHADLEARLADIGVIVDGLKGPVSTRISADRTAGRWSILAAADGSGGMQLQGRGMIDESGQADGLALTGKVPLAIANLVIQPRSITGHADLDLTLDGPLALQSLSGRVSTSTLRVSDPSLQMALEEVTAVADLAGGTALVSAAGSFSTGGTLSAYGQIGLATPHQASLSLDLQDMRLIDPALYSARLSAAIAINGPLAGDADITGHVDLYMAEIRLSATGTSGSGTIPELVHVGEPGTVHATRRRAGLVATPSATGPAERPFRLDITVNAPTGIFLSGQGLDAELGGTLTLQGTTANVVPEGEFTLIRGWLDIPGRRLALSEGMARLQGHFVPFFRIVASAEAGDVTVNVILSGRADDLEVTFASQPELPEEEALAQLLFGRSITRISPIQAAHMADTASRLAGRGGSGAIDRLRRNFGLDDLNVESGDEGETSLRAGKFLSDRLYTEIEVGSDGVTDINLNLDLGRSVTVKGETGAQGDTSVGVFFERDY